MNHANPDHPLLSLPPEDLDLITQLVLKSGSIKDLATAYGVSYPTVRARLDRVIERLQAAVEKRPRDPLAELLADLVERTELTPRAARAILEESRRLRSAQAGSVALNGQPQQQQKQQGA